MTNSLGKHLIIDCYGCKKNQLQNYSLFYDAIKDFSQSTGMDLLDVSIKKQSTNSVLSYIGIGNQLCIHIYPDLRYLAIDFFTFDTDIDPTEIMKIIRQYFRPDKIRATSVRRGQLTPKDMKPQVKSKTTALRKVKKTGMQLKKTGNKVLKALVKRQ